MTSQVLLALLPSVFMLLVVFFVFKSFFEKQFDFAKTKSEAEIVFPLKIQAYERITLLLERIKLENLLLRINLDSFETGGFHGFLLNEIRNEFNHNLAQQLYIKSETWELVNMAVNGTMVDINQNLSNLSFGQEKTKYLATKILTNPDLKSPALIKVALDALKKDFQNNF